VSLIPRKYTIDLQRYITRRISLYDYFYHHDSSEDATDNAPLGKMFRKKSSWTPSTRQLSDKTLNTIDSICEVSSNLIAGKKFIQGENEYITQSTRPNLTKSQIRTIKQLKNNADIIIKPVDKGGAVVVMQTQLYRSEAIRQLSNTKYYRPLDSPLYVVMAQRIYEILHRMSREAKISQANVSYLKPDLKTITPRYFYLLPKIHKPRQSWPHADTPAGRPIVSDCNSESTRVCEFIDYFLQPVSTLHTSYLKDTYHFIERVKGFKTEPHWLLISADVESLYTNMQIDLIIQ